MRRLDARRHRARSSPPTARSTSAASSRCAATCPAARRRPASSATRPNWSRFIRETQGSDWHIEVAAYPEYHPQQRYAARDLQHFADKVKAGADSAITQFFFNPDAYFHFVDETRALGVTVPIVPGIMPFHNYAKIAQFAARDGIDIPRWVALKMEGFMDDSASIRAFGLDVVTRLCERLIDGGAPGIHFYTLNQSALALEICRRLGTRAG